MYYEEKVIDGQLYYRTTPDGPWAVVQYPELVSRLMVAEKRSHTFDQAREALTSLSNEVSALLGLQEEELRDLVGHSNVGCLKERLRQAKEALAAMGATS